MFYFEQWGGRERDCQIICEKNIAVGYFQVVMVSIVTQATITVKLIRVLLLNR